jgi:hypothetical protein
MVPEGNQIAESVFEAKKIICHLRIEVKKIHACKNNCLLFCGDYADFDKCPMCCYGRYTRKKDVGDDNNSDDENKPWRSEARRRRLTEWLLCEWHGIFASFLNGKDGSQHERRPNSCVGMRKAERSKMTGLGT